MGLGEADRARLHILLLLRIGELKGGWIRLAFRLL